MIIPGSPPTFPPSYVAPTSALNTPLNTPPTRHTKLAITAASAAGFFVTGYTSTHDFTPVLFAGSLAECLGYMAQSLGPQPVFASGGLASVGAQQTHPVRQDVEERYRGKTYMAQYRVNGEPNQ